MINTENYLELINNDGENYKVFVNDSTIKVNISCHKLISALRNTIRYHLPTTLFCHGNGTDGALIELRIYDEFVTFKIYSDNSCIVNSFGILEFCNELKINFESLI